MNTSLCKNLQDIDKNTNVKFDVCECCWSEDLWLSVGENCFYKYVLYLKSIETSR